MTNEDAAVRLRFYETQVCVRECMAHRGYFDECDFCEDIEMMDKAIKALEKQIPKKPNAYHTRFFGDDRMAYDCPNCKHCFTMMKPNYNDNILRNQYCDICGQAIDWSEVEE